MIGCRRRAFVQHADEMEVNMQPLPVRIVTAAWQLPPGFREPSPQTPIVIGFDCEGVDLARYGQLCIMQLAWEHEVYLVDAVVGGSPLMEACRRGLESPYVTKVVHDCKRDSEALYFQHGIKLQGVFDTQIAYTMIEEMDDRGDRKIDDSISFVGLLADERYCGVEYDEKQEVREIMRKDKEFWVHRPWTPMMERVAADDVRFLLRIYGRMRQKLDGRPRALEQLALRSSMYCRCFCVGATDWPQPPRQNEANGNDAEGWPDEVVLKVVDVPEGLMGRVIGKKGASIREIKDACSRAVIFTGGTKGPLNKVFVMGPVKTAEMAEAIIRGYFQ
eukprot:TRINITY_DN5119_c3_g4_i2.p1 TRINITY_DN5119_c3_g4~~TRINITY_DN5119_c3_g4_i2.p1  ORF type:complete len:332 (+),score=73.97 TRINITY_DN5119_c3_g4_i2:441-1436(+)